MLIPEVEALYFLAGAAFGVFATLIILFLTALLYRMDDARLYADEINFEKPKRKFAVISKKPEEVA